MYSFVFIIPFLVAIIINIPRGGEEVLNDDEDSPPNININNILIQPQTTLPQNIEGTALGHPLGLTIPQREPFPPPSITSTTPIIRSSGVVAASEIGGRNEATIEDVASGSANVGLLPMKRRREHIDFQETSWSSSSSSPLQMPIDDEQQIVEPNNEAILGEQEQHVEQQFIEPTHEDILVEQEQHVEQQFIEPNNEEMHVEQEQQVEPSNDEVGFSCVVCGRVFTTRRSMFGHMRSHGDRQWRGVYPPPRFSLDGFEDLIRIYNQIHREDDDEGVREPNEQPPIVVIDIDLNQPRIGDEYGIDLNKPPPDEDDN